MGNYYSLSFFENQKITVTYSDQNMKETKIKDKEIFKALKQIIESIKNAKFPDSKKIEDIQFETIIKDIKTEVLIPFYGESLPKTISLTYFALDKFLEKHNYYIIDEQKKCTFCKCLLNDVYYYCKREECKDLLYCNSCFNEKGKIHSHSLSRNYKNQNESQKSEEKICLTCGQKIRKYCYICQTCNKNYYFCESCSKPHEKLYSHNLQLNIKQNNQDIPMVDSLKDERENIFLKLDKNYKLSKKYLKVFIKQKIAESNNDYQKALNSILETPPVSIFNEDFESRFNLAFNTHLNSLRVKE